MARRLRKFATPAVVALLALWLGFVGVVNWEMHQSPEHFGQFMAKMPMPAYFLFPFETMWTRARGGTLNVGDVAPDFNLEAQDKSGSMKLSSFRGQRPVVLVFGSYT